MSDSGSRTITEADLMALTKAARLDLAPERVPVVTGALDGVLQLFDSLDSVELGETPPTNSFDARWRNLP